MCNQSSSHFIREVCKSKDVAWVSRDWGLREKGKDSITGAPYTISCQDISMFRAESVDLEGMHEMLDLVGPRGSSANINLVIMEHVHEEILQNRA